MSHENYTPELRRILAIAAIEAEREQAGLVSVHHVLIAIAMDNLSIGAAMFQQQGLTLEDIRALNFDKKQKEAP